ncbi:MAG TPA: hypothetical protein PLN52_00140 [Opitutaceae bacterium]|nr:hypothetical protein [Opitutaceae bacterium]
MRLFAFALAAVLLSSSLFGGVFFFAPAQPVLYSTVPDENGLLWGRDFEAATQFALGEKPKGLPLERGDRLWYSSQTGNDGYLRTLSLTDTLTSRTYTVKLAGPETWLRAIRSGRYLYKSVVDKATTALDEVDLLDPAQKTTRVLKTFDPTKTWFSPDGAVLIHLAKDELHHVDLTSRKSTRIQKLKTADVARFVRVEFIDPTGRGWISVFNQQRPLPYQKIFRNLFGEERDLTALYPPPSTQIGALDSFEVHYDGFRNRLITFDKKPGDKVHLTVLDPSGKKEPEEHFFSVRLPQRYDVHLMPGGGLVFVSDKEPPLDYRLARFDVLDLVAKEVRSEFFLPTAAEHTFGDAAYVGETLDGKRHGYGLCLWPDGSSYRGDWSDDQRDGEGTWKKGDDLVTGTWAKGQAVLVAKTYAPAPNLRFEYEGPLDDKLRPHGRGITRVLIVDPKTKIVVPNGFFGIVEGWFEAGELRFGLALQHKILADYKTQQLPVYLGFFQGNRASGVGRVPVSAKEFSGWIQPYGQFQTSDVTKPFSRRAGAAQPTTIEATLAATSYLDVIADLETRLVPLLERTAKETAVSTLVFERQRREREAERARLAEEARLASEREAQEALKRAKEAAVFQEKIYAYDRTRSGRGTNGAQANLNSRQQLQHYRRGDFVAYEGMIVRIESDPTYDRVVLSNGAVLHGSLNLCSATVKPDHFRTNCPDCFGRGFQGTPTTQTITSSSPYTRTYTSTLGTTWRETGNETTTTTVRSYARVRCNHCNGSGRTTQFRTLHY